MIVTYEFPPRSFAPKNRNGLITRVIQQIESPKELLFDTFCRSILLPKLLQEIRRSSRIAVRTRLYCILFHDICEKHKNGFEYVIVYIVVSLIRVKCYCMARSDRTGSELPLNEIVFRITTNR